MSDEETIDITKLVEDRRERTVEYGVRFPDGTEAFHTSVAPYNARLAFMPERLDLSTMENQGKARDAYRRNLVQLGIDTDFVDELVFLSRVRYAFISDPQEIN